LERARIRRVLPPATLQGGALVVHFTNRKNAPLLFSTRLGTRPFRDLIRGGLDKESVRARLRRIRSRSVERRTLQRSVGIHSARDPEGLGAAEPPPQAGLLVADRLGVSRAAQADPLRLSTYDKKHFTAVVREQLE
jgi:hypothetical protein